MFVLACDSKSTSEETKDIAAAFSQSDANAAKRQATEGLKRLEEKAAAEAAKVVDDELEKITAAPASVPEKLEPACDDAGVALSEFNEKRLANNPEGIGRWNAIKEPETKKFVTACTETGSPLVAACSANALRTASTANFGEDAVSTIVDRCKARHGGTAPPPG